METGILERIRALEADIEKHVDSIVQQDLFRDDVTLDRHRILLDHFKQLQAEKIRLLADKLLDAYLDSDEIVEAQTAPHKGAEIVSGALREFEAKIADIREYHHTYRDLQPIRGDLEQPDPRLLETLFSVSERYGACLDLEIHYNHYSAFMITTGALATELQSAHDISSIAQEIAHFSRGWEGRLEYFRFIPALPHLFTQSISAYRKVVGFQLYRTFVRDLLTYLSSFFGRVCLLQQDVLQRLIVKVENECDEFWSVLVEVKGQVQPLTGSITSEVDEESRVADGGASAIAGSSKACDVTIPPPLRRFRKSFGVWPLAFVERYLAKSHAATKPDAVMEHFPTSLDEVKEVCVMEGTITALLQSLLFDTLERTEKILLRDYSKTTDELLLERATADEEFHRSLAEVKKKSSSTVEVTVAHAAQYDLQASMDDDPRDAAMTDQKEDTKEEFIGADGRPIARWLVQLQQLDKAFVCEVCGGTVYKGPKVFREHFGAERHAEGLRRLGVTQHLKEFEGITSIRAVIEMRNLVTNAPNPLRRRVREDHECEEMQDVQGKVVTTKDYMRFQRRRQ